jgi:acetyl-CoA carboxylase biotin carboxyl carrier protein
MRKTEPKTKRPAARATNTSADTPKAEVAKKRAVSEPEDNLSLSEIKQLIDLISEKQFNEFELVRGDFKLRLMKGVGGGLSNPVTANAQDLTGPRIAPLSASAPVPSAQASAPAAAPVQQEEKLHIVTSPIVGTFYRSPSPTAAVFANVGDTVDEGKVLCIIEAMKLMNEIPSDASGRIEKIFAENGQPVEFGQPLFGIKV